MIRTQILMNFFYNCLKQGGLKAAITADAIQGMVLIFVTVLISIQGAYETGSVREVYNINKKNGKLRKTLV